MLKIKQMICVGLLCIGTLISGCGDDKDIIGVKEGTLSYSKFDSKGIIRKIDGASPIGTALDKAFIDPSWKIDEQNGKKYVVFTGKLNPVGEKEEKFMLAFRNRGGYYDLAGITINDAPFPDGMQFVVLYAAIKRIIPDYDFTKNRIPADVISRMSTKKKRT